MRAQTLIPVNTLLSPNSAPTCPVDTVRVVRLFNKATINNSYLTETLLAKTPLGAIWQNDGPVFCAAKYGD